MRLILIYWAKKTALVALFKTTTIRAWSFKSSKTSRTWYYTNYTYQLKQSRLQHYFAYQEFNEDVAQINLQYLWKKAVATYSKRLMLLIAMTIHFILFRI
jgi:hypothetical protein